jgi:putative redox protein
MNTKRITFPNDRGELIAARLELPEDEQPLAYALFAHCFTCSKDLKVVVNMRPPGCSSVIPWVGAAVLRPE